MARLEHGCFSRKAIEVRREVREWVRLIRASIALAEVALLGVPEQGDASLTLARLRLEQAIEEELRALYEKVSALFLSKLRQPIDTTSPEAMARTVPRVLFWAGLGAAFVDLGRAAVLGPRRARFRSW